MDKLAFCERFVFLDRTRISFEGRPFLPEIYGARGRNLVLRCSRQTEKSTFLVNTILFEACMRPGIQMLFVCPREEQARVFSHSRLLPSLEQSPLIRRVLLSGGGRRPKVKSMMFANGSALFVRAAFHSGDACRGLSAQLLLVDEFQDVAEGDLPVLQETLSHAKNGRTILTGTPKSVDNHLESMFRQSSAHEWITDCPSCQRGVVLDERSLGSQGIICADCGAGIDPKLGRWVPRNPHSTWGDGFCICHPMVPWLNYDDILERQRIYDIAKFKNEVLGLATTAGDHIVTRAELEACCDNTPMARSLEDIPPAVRSKLVVGIDWGGGGKSRTVATVGYMESDYRFRVCRFERFSATEDPDRVLSALAELCRRFQIRQVAADGEGSGHVYNRLLVKDAQLPQLCAIIYSAADHQPRKDGVLVKWTVNRSASIGVVFSRIKKQQMLFPRVAECGSLLDEFAAEIAEYDDINRSLKYSHPESQQDDALHATNYALLLATRIFSPVQRHMADW